MKTNEIKALIVKNGMTQSDLAKALNITPKTLSNKLKTGKFGSDEMSTMINVLHIDNPCQIFFEN